MTLPQIIEAYTAEQREVLDHLNKGVRMLENVIGNARLVAAPGDHRQLDIAALHLDQLAVMVTRAIAHATPTQGSAK